MIWIEFAILLVAILIGSRIKGVGLGVMGMIGMMIFTLGFHMQPADPPVEVLLIILCVVSTAAGLQAAGGMDYLVTVAEKILRRKPSQIIFLGPLATYSFTLFAGTSHINYSILPIIAEVATKSRIRPERPLSISVIASHLALTASPVSAATATMVLLMRDYAGLELIDVLKICIPATLVGIFAGMLSVLKMGKDLDKDPVFLEKMKDPAFAAQLDADTSGVKKELKPGAKLAVLLFGLGVLTIILIGSFPNLLPNFADVDGFQPNLVVGGDGRIRMAAMIQMVMLSVLACIIIFCKTSAMEVAKASLFSAGAQAAISVLGVVWMSATFMNTNEAVIERSMSVIVQDHPWMFAFALFFLCTLLFSQAATTRALMPLGISLGIAAPHLVAMFPAANGDFVLPGYPTLLAAIEFDRTGSTRVGKYLINHSFMLPGLVSVSVAVATGFLLAAILL
ncbi:anaerobic C4-dicarboxylate transporter DcuA [Chitinophaga skermanii]|uniref:Anaerobic C4-dicarboxylate transporter DcuA n=1 Tax=Chitinophaga skermanii TaxID=331697 RepID=A0A327QPS2_9BACT|nr:anaerobic C4-dicarboxylate transporter [Chitinophaga skermanii]RAJ05353.1 anaerobic C4-dicarboxylate transporter DcuA [Chitinophaga skermanii]